MQTRDILYVLCGYLCGSVLFARVFSQLFYHRDVTEDSEDKNPGTSNMFKCGGMLCGILTLLCDLAKGIIPVHMYIRGASDSDFGLALALVIAAPVVGHIFPIFYRFKGGKAIAVSFGTLLGLFPVFLMPALILAAAFLFFSLVIKVSPHYYRTMVAYGVAAVLIFIFSDSPFAVAVGFLISAVTITVKLLRSTEEKDTLEVRAAWKH